MIKEITREEFMTLSDHDIATIINKNKRPKAAVLIPDGNRRFAMSFLNMMPNSKDFETEYMKNNSEAFMKNLQIMYSHGLNTLFIPCMKHENFFRDKEYVKAITQFSLKLIFTDKKWIDFYQDNDIKVKIYGDLDYVKNKGYEELLQHAYDLEKITENNKKHKLFFGIACSNKHEYPRLMDMAIEFYKKFNRKPSYQEKLELYYGENVDDIDLFIRPTELRDSDIQPPLISGQQTQMYFLVAPDSISFNKDVYRNILYDYLYCRTSEFGIKTYQDKIINKSDLEEIKDYYSQNMHTIISTGKRIGNFWVPEVKIITPKK